MVQNDERHLSVASIRLKNLLFAPAPLPNKQSGTCGRFSHSKMIYQQQRQQITIPTTFTTTTTATATTITTTTTATSTTSATTTTAELSSRNHRMTMKTPLTPTTTTTTSNLWSALRENKWNTKNKNKSGEGSLKTSALVLESQFSIGDLQLRI